MIKKYSHIISYLVFGVLTTLVNMAVYYLCYNRAGMANLIATGLAWLASVIFAFITNKLWVFGSKDLSWAILKKEISGFFSARIATGLLDAAIMFVAVDVMGGSGSLWKLISNVLVVILNYIAGRFLVFKN